MQEILARALSPDANTRQSAERALERVLIDEQDAAVQLIQLALDDNTDTNLRQIAAITLRRYIRIKWSPSFEKFHGGLAAPLEIKNFVRPKLLQALASPLRQVRTACAACICEVAHSDYPDEWPDLFDQLVGFLTDNATIDTANGALRVLSELMGTDLSEDQLIPLAQTVLPTLLGILQNSSAPSSMRARTLVILKQTVASLYMVKEQFPQAVEQAVSLILPQWIVAIRATLNSDARTGTGMITIRTQCYRCLDAILSTFAKTLQLEIQNLILLSTRDLSGYSNEFSRSYLTEDGAVDAIPADESDVAATLQQLITEVLAFLHRAVGKKGAKKSLLEQGERPTATFQEMMRNVIVYSQITTDLEDKWDDPNAFLADEEDEALSFGLRSATSEVLEALAELAPSQTVESLQNAVQQLQSDILSWRLKEAILFTLGSVISAVGQDTKGNNFNLPSLYHSLVVPVFSSPNTAEFLFARAVILSSQMIGSLSDTEARQILDACFQALQSSETSAIIKIASVKAIFTAVRQSHALASQASACLSTLANLLESATEGSLSLLLQTIEEVYRAADDENCRNASIILSNRALQAWQRQSDDPQVLASVSELLAAMILQPLPAFTAHVVQTTLPSLLQLLDADSPHIPSSSMALIDAIMTAWPGPISEPIFGVVGPPIVAFLMHTDDRSVTQDGLDVISQCIKKCPQQIIAWHDGKQSGIEAVFRLVAHILRPEQDESGGLFIGDLILHLIRQAGHVVGPVLPGLLSALIARLLTAKTAMFSQSLITPFALLLYTQPQETCQIIDGIPSPPESQQTAWQILLTSWCDNAPTFQGFWFQRISSLGLGQLLLQNPAAIQSIIVNGDLIVVETNEIMTRSKTKARPDRFEQIPFAAKVLKLLAADLQADLNPAGYDALDDAVEEDGDDDWDNDPNYSAKAAIESMSEALGINPRKHFDEQDIGPDEDDFADDPVSQLDMRNVLAGILKECVAQDNGQRLQFLGRYLTAVEIQVLQSAVS